MDELFQETTGYWHLVILHLFTLSGDPVHLTSLVGGHLVLCSPADFMQILPMLFNGPMCEVLVIQIFTDNFDKLISKLLYDISHLADRPGSDVAKDADDET